MTKKNPKKNNRKDDRKQFGAHAEQIAARHLQKLGYRIVARNVRCRAGEIDLIARDGEILVFCEVKARRQGRFGDPAEAIDVRKQAQIITLANDYLHKLTTAVPVCRFDAVLMLWNGKEWAIRHEKDAFRPGW
ncbi:MAG: YraN family protein [Magnetococcales bacterium]|nr:YraN family protein [Magnetococcales bacterium]